jgi:hypothetical protein
MNNTERKERPPQGMTSHVGADGTMGSKGRRATLWKRDSTRSFRSTKRQSEQKDLVQRLSEK